MKVYLVVVSNGYMNMPKVIPYYDSDKAIERAKKQLKRIFLIWKKVILKDCFIFVII